MARLAALRTPRWRLAVAGLVLLALAAVAWWFLRAPEVVALRVEPAPLVRTLRFSGRVASLTRVDVGATLTGRVREVTVREGDAVQPGQRLVQLEEDELRAALAQAKAAQQQAVARLAGLRGTGRQAAAAYLAQAQAQERNAAAELRRAEELVAQGFVSASRLDDARRNLAVAQAQREAALAQASATAEKGTDLEQARAQLETARAVTEAAQARLAQARVLAPTAGRVLVRQVEPGQIVQPGRPLLALSLVGPTQLVAQVDERFLKQLRAGQHADAVADAFPGQRFSARVLSIAPAIDAQRGTVEVKLALDGAAPAFLREDLTLSIEVETGRREQALIVPLDALREDGAVLVAQDGKAALRPLQLGLRTLEAAEVLRGLARGDVVLRDPALRPGERVQPRVQTWQPTGRGDSGATRDDAGTALTNTIGR